MKRSIMLLLILSLLVGCATTYQNFGIMGKYSEKRLENNKFKISFKGKGFISKKQAEDFALLKCAKTSLQHGYRYFIVIEEDMKLTRKEKTRKVTSRNKHTDVKQVTITKETIKEPKALKTILCFNEPNTRFFTYDAETVYRRIRDKYDLD